MKGFITAVLCLFALGMPVYASADTGEMHSEIETVEEASVEEEAFSLSDEDREKVDQVIQKIKDGAPDTKELTDKVKDACEEAGEEIKDKAVGTVMDALKESIASYFEDLKNRVSGFLSSLFQQLP